MTGRKLDDDSKQDVLHPYFVTALLCRSVCMRACADSCMFLVIRVFSRRVKWSHVRGARMQPAARCPFLSPPLKRRRSYFLLPQLRNVVRPSGRPPESRPATCEVWDPAARTTSRCANCQPPRSGGGSSTLNKRRNGGGNKFNEWIRDRN